MSKASQVIVLCEDKAHEMFVTRFLKTGWRVKPRDIRVRSYPSGRGSGKKFVMDTVAQEVEALRRRAASTILLVIQDADEDSVDQAKSKLDARLETRRQSDEPIAYIIPKWHIQTWIAYLHGEDVDETDKTTYESRYRKLSESKDVHGPIDRLADRCKRNLPLESPPDSLVASCEEFSRVRDRLR